MRARYYSPELKRFINADIIPGQISDSITLNRYAYANGNPASLVDPFGLSADERYVTSYYSHNNIVTGVGFTRGYDGRLLDYNGTIPPLPKIRGKQYISENPYKEFTEIPYELLRQIKEAVTNYSTELGYTDNYSNAKVRYGDGTITYSFTVDTSFLFWKTRVVTEYNFEVKTVEEWSTLLDYDDSVLNKMFNNDFVDSCNEMLDEYIPPNSGLPLPVEFTTSAFSALTEIGGSLFENDISHNTEASSIVFNYIRNKNPGDRVAILRSAKTFSDTDFGTPFFEPKFKDEIEFF